MNQTYQTIQELENEIRQYALLGIVAVGMYKLARNNPEETRKFMSQLKFSLDKIVRDNPELEMKIPVQSQ